MQPKNRRRIEIAKIFKKDVIVRFMLRNHVRGGYKAVQVFLGYPEALPTSTASSSPFFPSRHLIITAASPFFIVSRAEDKEFTSNSNQLQGLTSGICG